MIGCDTEDLTFISLAREHAQEETLSPHTGAPAGAVIAYNAGVNRAIGIFTCWIALFTPGIMLIYGVMPWWGAFRRFQVYRRWVMQPCCLEDQATRGPCARAVFSTGSSMLQCARCLVRYQTPSGSAVARTTPLVIRATRSEKGADVRGF